MLDSTRSDEFVDDKFMNWPIMQKTEPVKSTMNKSFVEVVL